MPNRRPLSVPELLATAARRLTRAAQRPDQEALDLLSTAWRRSPTEILAGPKIIPVTIARRFQVFVRRRAAGEPFAYIVGWQPFYGLRIGVTPATLIPRPVTEEIVAAVLADFPNTKLRCVDVGTGSGCIALALKAARPNWTCIGTDTSPAALTVARRNARRLKFPVRFMTGTCPTTTRFDIIVANLPYLSQAEAAKASLRFEPRTALCGGGRGGLDSLRTFLAALPNHPARVLYLECLPRQIRPLKRIIAQRWPDAEQRSINFGRAAIGRRVTWSANT